MGDAKGEVVRLERFPEERIAVLTLDRPPLNAIDEQLATELAEATAALAGDRETVAVLVESAVEGVFMAGADITVFAGVDAAAADRIVQVQEVFTAFAELPQPAVAAISGHALGGGLELALACDFRFLARGEHRLGLPEVRLGLLPGAGGTQRLTRLVGPGRATAMIMKGLQLPPEEAERDGLVHFLVEPDELAEQARDFTVRLARQAPLALRGIKRAIRAASSAEGFAVEREAFREVLLSEDARAGVKAFLEGENASFSGR